MTPIMGGMRTQMFLMEAAPALIRGYRPVRHQDLVGVAMVDHLGQIFCKKYRRFEFVLDRTAADEEVERDVAGFCRGGFTEVAVDHPCHLEEGQDPMMVPKPRWLRARAHGFPTRGPNGMQEKQRREKCRQRRVSARSARASEAGTRRPATPIVKLPWCWQFAHLNVRRLPSCAEIAIGYASHCEHFGSRCSGARLSLIGRELAATASVPIVR